MNSVANAKFSNLGNSQAKFGSPLALEHLQQHKTKNYKKISLKMRKFTIQKKIYVENFENLRILRKILI